MIKWIIAELFGSGGEVPNGIETREAEIEAANDCRKESLKRHAEAARQLERRLGIRGVDQAFDEVGRHGD